MNIQMEKGVQGKVSGKEHRAPMSSPDMRLSVTPLLVHHPRSPVNLAGMTDY